MNAPSLVLDEARLESWGERVGRALRPPLFVALRGDLGAGKSTLARALARGAGVTEVMPSPTFNLLFRYAGDGDVTVVHSDLYRLEDPEEVWELGWEELPAPDQIVLVEWPERAEEYLPADRWEIALQEAQGGAARRVIVRAVGSPASFPAVEVG